MRVKYWTQQNGLYKLDSEGQTIIAYFSTFYEEGGEC